MLPAVPASLPPPLPPQADEEGDDEAPEEGADEDEEGFVVGDGYLSDDEGMRDDDDNQGEAGGRGNADLACACVYGFVERGRSCCT